MFTLLSQVHPVIVTIIGIVGGLTTGLILYSVKEIRDARKESTEQHGELRDAVVDVNHRLELHQQLEAPRLDAMSDKMDEAIKVNLEAHKRIMDRVDHLFNLLTGNKNP